MSGTIGGRAFHDTDNDGLRDEPSSSDPPNYVNGISNVVVHLHECRDDVELGTDETNTNGFYVFPNLSEGNYYVRAELPEGYEFSTVWVDDDGTNSIGGGNDNNNNTAPRLFRAESLGGYYDGDDDANNGGRDPADGDGGSGSSSHGLFDDERKSRDLLLSTDDGAEQPPNLRRTPASSDGVPVIAKNAREQPSPNRIHRTLGTGGGPVANSVEKSTVDPRTGRTVICINLDRGERNLEWGFGLYRVTDGPSVQPSSSGGPSVGPSAMGSSGGPSAMNSDAPSIAMSRSASPSYRPSEGVTTTTFENATNSPSSSPVMNPSVNPSVSPSPVPTITVVNPTPITPTTGGVVVAEDSRAPSSMPISIDDPTSNIGTSNQFSSSNNMHNNTQVGSSIDSININYIIGITCALSFLLLTVALVLHHRRSQQRRSSDHYNNKGNNGGEEFGPPSVVEVKREPEGDEISDMHVSSRRLQYSIGGVSNSKDALDLEESSYGGSVRRDDEGDEEAMERTRSRSSGSRESMAALSNIMERSCSGGSRSGDEEAPPPLPRVNSKVLPSGVMQSSHPPPNAYHKSFSDEGARNSTIHPKNAARPLSQSLPNSSTSISPTRSARREGHQQTMQALEEEVSSLTNAIESFPENSHMWLLLNSYLDRAREELEDFRSKQNNVVGGGEDVRDRSRNDVIGGNKVADSNNTSNEIIYRKEEQFVCGMEFFDDANNGDPLGKTLYTGQIDLESQLPHGLGTMRKDDAAGTMLEGEWEYGTLVKEIRTSDCGVSVVGVKVRADVRVALAPPPPMSAFPQNEQNGEIITQSSGNLVLPPPLPAGAASQIEEIITSSSGNLANAAAVSQRIVEIQEGGEGSIGGMTKGAYQSVPSLPVPDVSLDPPPPAAAASTTRFKIIAPSGHLGLVVDKTGEGPTFVRSLDLSSPMKDQIRVNDKIIAINGVELGSMTPAEIGFLLSSKRTKEISIVRESEGSISKVNDDDASEKELLPKATLPTSYRKSVDSDTTGETLSSTTDPFYTSHTVAAGEPLPKVTLGQSHKEEEESVGSDMSGTTMSHTTAQTFISHPDIDKIYKDMVCCFQGFDEESDLLPFFVGDEAMAGSSALDRKWLSTSLLSSTDVPESGANDSTITPVIEESAVGQF